MKDPNQVQFCTLAQLVPKNHVYRKILILIDFKKVTRSLVKRQEKILGGNPGYGINVLFKCLVLQFMEDLSDRELARFIQENNAAKYFCGFSLTQPTPHYSLFSRVRDRITPNQLGNLFARIRNILKKQGFILENFTFVDASHIIKKAQLWNERDKARVAQYEKLNNEVLPKVAADPDARIGCKGKDKYWYGYKKHVSLDMQSGLINKIAITPANLSDAKGLKHICPTRGGVFGDKGYCTSPAQRTLRARGCHSACIKKVNMKDKNKFLDRWYSHLRSPYERVFARSRRVCRYAGRAKNQFSAFLESICFNIKRLLVLNAPPLELAM